MLFPYSRSTFCWQSFFHRDIIYWNAARENNWMMLSLYQMTKSRQKNTEFIFSICYWHVMKWGRKVFKIPNSILYTNAENWNKIDFQFVHLFRRNTICWQMLITMQLAKYIYDINPFLWVNLCVLFASLTWTEILSEIPTCSLLS